MTLATIRHITALVGLAAAAGAAGCSNDTTAPRPREAAAHGAQLDGAPIDTLACRSGYVVIGGKVQCTG